MKRWIAAQERLPYDSWSGLIVTNVTPAEPVFAYRTTERFRRELPHANSFCGNWREALLTSEHDQKRAVVMYWLETDEDLYPPIPSMKAEARHE